MQKLKGWIPLITLGLSLMMGGAVAQYQITENKEAIKVLEKDREMQIRSEERQLAIIKDVAEIKRLLMEKLK